MLLEIIGVSTFIIIVGSGVASELIPERRLIKKQEVKIFNSLGKTFRIPYVMNDESIPVYEKVVLSKSGSVKDFDNIIGSIVYSLDVASSKDRVNCAETFKIIEFLPNGLGAIKIEMNGRTGYVYRREYNKLAEVQSLTSQDDKCLNPPNSTDKELNDFKNNFRLVSSLKDRAPSVI